MSSRLNVVENLEAPVKWLLLSGCPMGIKKAHWQVITCTETFAKRLEQFFTCPTWETLDLYWENFFLFETLRAAFFV